jgi:hypothetical protein
MYRHGQAEALERIRDALVALELAAGAMGGGQGATDSPGRSTFFGVSLPCQSQLNAV